LSISNGYLTLAELKEQLTIARTYTAATISFTVATKTIGDTASGLRRFQTGDIIQVSGSTKNNGYFTVTTGNTLGSIVVSETLTAESAGASVTITQVQDRIDDTILEKVAEGISRALDWRCRRKFYTSGTEESAEARYFTAEHSDRLYVDDLLSVDTLETDDGGDGTYESSWTEDTDFYLEPYNAALDYQPYTKVVTTESGSYSFPVGVRKGVKVSGVWGYWTSTPANIHSAALLMAERLFKRKDAIFGVVGSPELGVLKQIVRDDPEINALLFGMIRGGALF